MEYVLGVDFGGGASKATLLSREGKIIKTSLNEYKTYYGENGMAEQNPDDWFYAACENIKRVTEGIAAEELKCICFDATTHTAVLLDENFNVVRNSVYWTDTRFVKQVDFLKKHFGKDIFDRFKHNVDTIWTLPELLWIKENEPEVWGKVKKITFAKDYVRNRFTGDFVTDFVEAEGSMFFSFDEQKWDEKFLNVLGINESFLPTVVKPLTVTGRIKKELAAELGLSDKTKVIYGSTDTAMEVFAAGAITKGQTTVKLATAGRICVVSDKIIKDAQIINYSHLSDGLFYPGTATKSCASSFRWFRDSFGGEYNALCKSAESIPVGSDGLIFHPYLNGELTPYGNPKLRGSFIGIRSMHTKAHFVRAVLEGVAMSLVDCKKYLENKGVKMQSAFIIGGGANSVLWKQIVADALGITLVSTENNDSSFGSAMCAGISEGFFEDYAEAIKKCSVITGTTRPISGNSIKYRELFEKYKKIQSVLENVYDS